MNSIMIRSYDSFEKRNLSKRITEVDDKNCYRKLFKFILKYNINYIRNGNGIFFNLGSLDDDALSKIDYILTYYEYCKNKVSMNNI